MSDDTIQVVLIKEGRFGFQCSELASPVFTDERAWVTWLRESNTMRAERVEIRRNGALRSIGHRTTSGGYVWEAVPVR